jgi:hypothetical protein
MQHAQGFTQSHWMQPPGKYWHHITPAAAMVINVVMPDDGLQNKLPHMVEN